MSKQDPIEKKRSEEQKMLDVMIVIYCKGNHGTKTGELCSDCARLREYAWKRTALCPFMETKTFCSACKVHCYTKENREIIRSVMRYAGPRMMFVHPLLAFKHMRTTIREKIKAKNINSKHVKTDT